MSWILRIIFLLTGLILLGCNAQQFMQNRAPLPEVAIQAPVQTATALPPIQVHRMPPMATATTHIARTVFPTATPPVYRQEIGRTAQNHPIEAYQLGTGVTNIVLVGGIHGGYELNTIQLSYELLDHFNTHPELIPDSVSLTIIPAANPDGQFLVAGAVGRAGVKALSAETIRGRFNSAGVDLNRNWGCEWSAVATFQSSQISGGTAPHSELETQLLAQFLAERAVTGGVVIFYHSAADAIFTGQCGDARHPDTLTFASLYSVGSGYPLQQTFSAYTITGDASDYLNKIGVAAFTIELKTHSATDFAQNLAGLQAIFELIETRGKQ